MIIMITRSLLLWCLFGFLPLPVHAWGFFAHQRINRMAVFALPPEMLVFYKPHIDYLTRHATDPDRRRYVMAGEAPRHFIDIDHYGPPPYDNLPHNWQAAVDRYTTDTLNRYGILPWHLERLVQALTNAFMTRNGPRILKLSADIGHYVGDAQVPLHASTNHNGQLSGQEGIHALWESRIPELFADTQFSYWIGLAQYLPSPQQFIWEAVISSGRAADTVLRAEQTLRQQYPEAERYAFGFRKGKLARDYAYAYTQRYQQLLGDMVVRRMRASMAGVASIWYTAWVNAGQPDLRGLQA
ncbi:MAG TPA: zinc dependent phospholipase C family protein [Chitinophaga sp.]